MKPLLSATIQDTSAIRYPALVSTKLDGIRCLVIDGVAVSRNLKPIRNDHVQQSIARLGKDAEGLDGELIVGSEFSPTCYRDTSSGVMSYSGTPDFRFHVFDRFNIDAPYTDRLSTLPATGGIIQRVEQTPVHTEAELLLIESDLLAVGAEGVMVRSLDGAYKHGRSTLRDGIIGKLKRFTDAEFKVVGSIERMHNANDAGVDALGYVERSTAKSGMVPCGDLGALICRTADGSTFNVGGGFTAADRVAMWAKRDWLVGRIAKVKFFAPGGYDVPRFPVFLGWAAQ